MTTAIATIDLSLDRIRKLVTRFPPYTRPTIHITGTNGKGSVTSIVTSILRESDMKVGKFNSPHLIHPRDAIEIGGIPVEEERYTEMYARVERANSSSGNTESWGGEVVEIGASPFEVLTVTALQLFEEEQVDMAVIEVGMGGRLDATNILPHDNGVVKVSAMTMVDLDHTRWLGSTVAAIAHEKASIARHGAPFVLGPQGIKWEDNVYRVVRECTGSVGTTLRRGARVSPLASYNSFQTALSPNGLAPSPTKVIYLSPTHGGSSEPQEIILDISLRGAHQIDNLSTALGIIESLQETTGTMGSVPQITMEAIIRGVANVRWPGRLEFIRYTPVETGRSCMVLLDGAHNKSSATALRAYLDSILPQGARVSFILALSDSPPKTPADTLTPLLREGDSVLGTQFSSVEGMPWVRPVDPREIQRVAAVLVGKTGVVLEPAENEESHVGPFSPPEGLEAALQVATGASNSDLVVVAGSLYLVADFFRLMEARPQQFNRL